jgi:hypothetical protein
MHWFRLPSPVLGWDLLGPTVLKTNPILLGGDIAKLKLAERNFLSGWFNFGFVARERSRGEQLSWIRSETFRFLLYKIQDSWNPDEANSVPAKQLQCRQKKEIPKVEVVQVDVNVDNPDTNLVSFPSSTEVRGLTNVDHTFLVTLRSRYYFDHEVHCCLHPCSCCFGFGLCPGSCR